MELDEMKAAWAALDQRLERQEKLNLHAIRETGLDRLRTTLRPLVVGPIVQIVAGALMALVFAPFWIDHRETLHWVVTGLSLHGYALMLIVFGARDLYLVHRIDYAAPIVEIQQRIAELRAWRVRMAPVFGVTGCLIWVPFLLWLFEVLFGVDVYALNPNVVYVLIGSGFGCIGLMLLVIRWTRHPRFERFGTALENSVAGRSIAKAQRLADEISAFVRDA